MVDLDLDIITQKQKTIKLFDKEVKLRNVTVEEHLNNEYLVQDLNGLLLTDKKNVKKAARMIQEYMIRILEIDDKTAAKVSIDQYRKIRQFLERKDMYDQGFNDREIDMLEKKALKNQTAQL